MVSFLEAVSQQLPENFEIKTTHLRIANAEEGADIKIIKGDVAEYDHFENAVSILGETNTEGKYTVFTPLVPFDQETPYTLIYNGSNFGFEITRLAEDVKMEVTSIYPSIDQVPANILKWYIQFSKPVNPIKIYDHIQFLDQDGKAIDRSILHLGAPLLSEDGTLLTVWVEPGRQKRLLGPNQHLGSVFEADKKYTLHIAESLKDASGLTIEKSISHHFTTITSDRKKPSIAQWEIMPIVSNNRQPLLIKSKEHLDFGSLLDAVSLHYHGTPIEGKLSYDSNTTTIYFTPKENWKKGIYIVKIKSHLEDLAGNNLNDLFDRPVQNKDKQDSTNEFTLQIDCQ